MSSIEQATLLEQVDRCASAFELAWRHPQRPRIADYLAGHTDALRRELLHELVMLDISYRIKHGEHPALEEYAREFPELLQSDGSLPAHLVLQAREMRAPSHDTTSGANPSPRLVGASPVSVRCPECGECVRVDGSGNEVICTNCSRHFSVETGSGLPFAVAELPRTLGQFQLLELLGQGSFGAVYRAQDAQLGRMVAIKVPRSGAFAGQREKDRFLREARNAARLQHPSIVQVHEVAHAGDMIYIVSDYVEGRTLAQQLVTKRPGFMESAELVALVAEALEYAHQRGVIHRDINPRNILMDQTGRPHITDFGLAHGEESSVLVSLDGQILGTPAYMAPEQAEGKLSQVGAASDVYALGVVLYELLTGEPPFRGNVTMILHQVIHDEPRPPRSLNDRIPRDLETICLKAMAKTPARRYRTADALAQDLRHALHNEPIEARPVGRVERGLRWCQRHRLVAGLALLVILLLLAVAIGSTVFALVRGKLVENERGARRDAEQNLLNSQRALAQEQRAKGLALLEDRNALGLLDLLEAKRTIDGTHSDDEWPARIWSVWYGACPLRLEQMMGHDSPATLLAFSADGKLLVSSAPFQYARFWDPLSGAQVHDPLPTFAELVAFCPAKNLFARVTPNNRRRVDIVNATTMETVGPPLEYPSDCGALLLSPDGRWLLVDVDETGSTLSLTDLETRTSRSLPSRGGYNTFTADGSRLFISDGTAGTIRTLGNSTASVLLDDKNRHTAPIQCLSFSRDGKYLATGGEDSTVRLWDTGNGKAAGEPLRHPEHVRALALSPDGELVATACMDGSARIWDWRSGTLKVPALQHEGPVTQVAFSPNGKLLATGSFDSTVRVWNVVSGQLHGWPLRHGGIIKALTFDPDGTSLATSAGDLAVRIWKLPENQPRSLRDSPMKGSTAKAAAHRVWSVAFSPDSSRLACAVESGDAGVYDVATGTLVRSAPHATDLLCVDYSPDRSQLITSGGGKLHLWDDTDRPLQALSMPNAQTFAMSPDRRYLVIFGAYEQIATLLDARSLKPVPGCGMLKHDFKIECAAFSPDGKMLATGAYDRTVRLWTVPDGKPLHHPLPHNDWVESVAFSPDGKWLASASRDNTVQLWDPGTGSKIGGPLLQQNFAQMLTFSPDSAYLATASVDGKVRLWDIQSRSPCTTPLQHDQMAMAVRFSPDGKWLASGGFDGSVKIWQLPKHISNLEEMELRTWVALGYRFDASGAVQLIPWREWQELRLQLQAKIRSVRDGPG